MSTEERICQEFLERRKKGLLKYGRSVDERPDLSYKDWLQHHKEELMDALIYIQKELDTQPK